MSTSEPGPPWPGQDALWRTLARLRAEARVPGSVLVIGMRGLPSAPYADAVADGLVCATPVGGRACGACPDCGLMRAGTHPDRLRIAPEGSQVRIDAVREAVQWAGYRPQRARVRVVRVDGADRMGAEAAVAALKGVEEPPAATHWVLSADAPGRVHGPLRSRCVPLPLRTVSAPEIGAWLASRGIDPDEARRRAAGAAGFPEDALDAGARVQAEATGAGDDAEHLARALRRDLHEALRAGRLAGGQARAVLSLCALAEQGLRRAAPPRLVADALQAAAERLQAALL